MTLNWQQYFEKEQMLEDFATDAGLAPSRARALAERVAAVPVSRHAAVGLLLRIGTAGGDDAVVGAAHRLLDSLDPGGTPPLALIRVCATGNSDARCVNGVIFVNPDSPQYQRAANGDAIPLAAVLLHEQVHRCGGGEPDAYARELAFLTQHNADPGVIAEIRELHCMAIEEARNVMPTRGVL